MNELGLAAWLTLGAALLAIGWLAACVRRDRGGVLTATVLTLAAAVLSLAALVRHAVLPASALALVPLVLVLGAVLLLAGELMAGRKEEP